MKTNLLIILVLLITVACDVKNTRRIRGGTFTETGDNTPGNNDSGNNDPGSEDPGDGGDGVTPTPNPTPPAVQILTEERLLATMRQREAQRAVLCARPGTDRVRQLFCGATPPVITGIADLRTQLGIQLSAAARNAATNIAVVGHSSSLVARHTSPINPRAIAFANGANAATLVAMGFVRGEQFVELVSRDPGTNLLKFFLLKFEQACNAQPAGCSIGELLTPAIETNWTAVTLYEDEDLKNTVFDCRQCHQPDFSQPPILRMQEQRDPWTHWFRSNRPSNVTITDYLNAHGNETYAGIPNGQVQNSEPQNLERFIQDAGFRNLQFNEFETGDIEDEVAASNVPVNAALSSSPSATWNNLFQNFLNGTIANAVIGSVIAPPFYGIRVTDPAKLAAATAMYTQFRNNQITAAQVTDFREVFLDNRVHEMGFGVPPTVTTGRGILIAACAQCHNNRLDPNITRARFSIDVTAANPIASVPAAVKQTAVFRIGRPTNDVLRMPPHRFRDLTDAQKNTLVQYLQSN